MTITIRELGPGFAGEVHGLDMRTPLSREDADIGSLASNSKWTLTEATEGQRVWTDDYSNVLGAVWRRLRSND